MPSRTGLGMRLYLHGVDLSADVGAISSISSTRNTQDTTALTHSAMRRLSLLKDAEVTFTSFFNDDTGAAFDTLSARPTTDVLAMILLGTTLNDPVFCLSAKQVNYDINRGSDGSITVTTQLIGATGVPLESARLLTAKVTHASATDVTGSDFGAQTTSGAVGYLQHFTASTGTVEYDIEDSANSTNGVDGTWGNLLAFSDVATPYSPIAQRVVVAGTVERWTRASTNGTFTGAQFAVALRRRHANEYDAA